MNKNLVCQRFSKNLKTYNENAKIQKQMAEKLISMLPQDNFSKIFEIGCGTGLLTEIVASKLKYNSYFANDIVKDCSEYIANIDSQIKFLPGDIEQLINNIDDSFDLIISNASFQWIENLQEFVLNLIKHLNKNGVLLFSTFGKENYREIYNVVGKSLKYFSKNEILEMFNDYSVDAEEEIRILMFSSPKEVLKHVHSTGVNALSNEIWTKKDMQIFENGYNNYCSSRPTLTYNPLYIRICV